MSAAPRTALAPAKLNLWLAIRGRRDDGYHELATLMLALELADELEATATPEPGVGVEVTGPAASPDVPLDGRNLAVRAAEAVRADLAALRGEPSPGLRLRLEKRVPSQAGLGGGSSDAAAALDLACRALDHDPGPDWRRRTLAGLGSDCVFFHEVGPSALARCEGRGERVTALHGEPPRWSLALLVPELRSPTAAVFAALSGVPRVAVGEVPGPELARMRASEARAHLATDLEPAALAAVPGLAAWRALLDEEGAAHFRLSGSGSAWFGLFDEPSVAQEETTRLRECAGRAGLALRLATVTRAAGAGR